MNMKRSRKRVSWASGANLCQIKVFSSENCPASVVLKSSGSPQAKKLSPMVHSDTTGYDDLPPGFELCRPVSQAQAKPLCRPQIPWRDPRKFVLNDAWQVGSGEFSEETKVQMLREMRVLEAVYPSPSAIPPNPSVSSEVENEHYDDRLTPVLSLIPIEERESANTQPDAIPLPSFSQVRAPPLKPLPDLGKLPAAAAALITKMTSNEKGNLIDTDLLVKILSDPNTIQKLMRDEQVTPSVHRPQQFAPQVSLPIPKPLVTLPGPSQVKSSVNSISVQPNTAARYTFPVKEALVTPATTGTPATTVTPSLAPPRILKDMNYYKHLIRQHGEDQKEEIKETNLAQNEKNNFHFEDTKSGLKSKPKNLKPCIFYDTPKGCRNGVNCTFLHDVPSVNCRGGRSEEQMDFQIAKRMKLSGEISGR